MLQNMRRCPIQNTFRIMGKKFTPLIIRNMILYGHKRFNQFLEIEGVNAKILSTRLKEMEKDSLIKREVFNETPVRIEYTLTEKGMALERILNQMAAFSMEHYPKDVFKDGKPREFGEVYGYRVSRNGISRR